MTRQPGAATIRIERTDSFQFNRPARIASRTLNFLIFGCAALILAVYLIAVASSCAGISDRFGTAIWSTLSLVVLFSALDVLVILRLARPVAATVAARLAPRRARNIVFGIGSVFALAVSVIVFFFATCNAMLRVF
jgi:hypothetical protein